MRVLVVDDDQDILDLVAFNLGKAGLDCRIALDGVQGLKLALTDSPDLIVLDIMLPGLTGIQVLERLKSDSVARGIPVILLTAKSQEADRVRGLELGADDYVTKPFSVRELVLRVRRTLDRVRPSVDEKNVLTFQGIEIDLDRHEVRIRDRVVSLTAIEFKLLAALIRNPGHVLTRARLLEDVWGYSYFGNTRTVDTHIQRLREKLGPASDCIETIRGYGYRVGIDEKAAPRAEN